MKLAAFLLLLTACVAQGARVPLAVWQFGTMIQCVQPRVNPLKYDNYGCWCGLGGTGTPRDDVDRCCKAHDLCYRDSKFLPECRPIIDAPYVKIYDHTCKNNQVSCSASNDPCQAFVCDCDRVAAHCFAAHKYNPENKNLDPKVHCIN